MKWAILCISSSFCISFPYLYTTFTKPLLHFLVFAFTLHTHCVSGVYGETTPLFAFILPSSSFISRQFSHSIHTYLPIGSYSFQHRSIPLKSCIQTLIQVTDYTIRV